MFQLVDRVARRLVSVLDADGSVSVEEVDWREGDLLRSPGHSHSFLQIQSIDEENNRVTVRSPRSGNWYIRPLRKLVATHTNETAQERGHNGRVD